MHWAMWVWVVAMAVVTIAGTATDWKEKEPLWYTALGLLSGASCVLFVLVHAELLALGSLTIPAALVLLALVYEAWHDVSQEQELGPWMKVVAASLALTLFAPAPALVLVGSLATD